MQNRKICISFIGAFSIAYYACASDVRMPTLPPVDFYGSENEDNILNIREAYEDVAKELLEFEDISDAQKQRKLADIQTRAKTLQITELKKELMKLSSQLSTKRQLKQIEEMKQSSGFIKANNTVVSPFGTQAAREELIKQAPDNSLNYSIAAAQMQNINAYTLGVSSDISRANELVTANSAITNGSSSGIYGAQGMREIFRVEKKINTNDTPETADITFKVFDKDGSTLTHTTRDVKLVCSDSSFITKNDHKLKEFPAFDAFIFPMSTVLPLVLKAYCQTNFRGWSSRLSPKCLEYIYNRHGTRAIESLKRCQSLSDAEMQLHTTQTDAGDLAYSIRCKGKRAEGWRLRWELIEDSFGRYKVQEAPFFTDTELAMQYVTTNVTKNEAGTRYSTNSNNPSNFVGAEDCISVDRKYLDAQNETQRYVFELIMQDLNKTLLPRGVLDIKQDAKAANSDLKLSQNGLLNTWSLYAINQANDEDYSPTKLDFNTLSAANDKAGGTPFADQDYKANPSNISPAGALQPNASSVKSGEAMKAINKELDRQKRNNTALRITDSKFTHFNEKAAAEGMLHYEDNVREHMNNSTQIQPQMTDGKITYTAPTQTIEDVKEKHDNNELALASAPAPQKTSIFENSSVMANETVFASDGTGKKEVSKMTRKHIYYAPRSCLVSTNKALAFTNHEGFTSSDIKQSKRLGRQSDSNSTAMTKHLITETRNCSIVVNTKPVIKNGETFEIGELIEAYKCPVDPNADEHVVSGVLGVTAADDPDNPCRPLKEFTAHNLAQMAVADEAAKAIRNQVATAKSYAGNNSLDIDEMRAQIRIFAGERYRILDIIAPKVNIAGRDQEICCINHEGNRGGKYDAIKYVLDTPEANEKAMPMLIELDKMFSELVSQTDLFNTKCSFATEEAKNASDSECDFATNRQNAINKHESNVEQFCEQHSDLLSSLELECTEFIKKYRQIWNLQYGLYFNDEQLKKDENGYISNHWAGGRYGSNRCDISWAYSAALGEIDQEKANLFDLFIPPDPAHLRSKLPNTAKCRSDKDNHIKLATKQMNGGCFFTGYDADIPKKVLGVSLGNAKYSRFYCCVDSELARVIQSEAATQLGKTPTELCEGIKIDELQALDFAKMDTARIAAAMGINMRDIKKTMQKRKNNELHIVDESGNKLPQLAGEPLPEENSKNLDDIKIATINNKGISADDLAKISGQQTIDILSERENEERLQSLSGNSSTREAKLLEKLSIVERADATDKPENRSSLTSKRAIELYNELRGGVAPKRANELEQEIDAYLQERKRISDKADGAGDTYSEILNKLKSKR